MMLLDHKKIAGCPVLRSIATEWYRVQMGDQLDKAGQQRRAFKCADEARIYAALALDRGGRRDQAEQLRKVPPVVCRESALVAANVAQDLYCAAMGAHYADGCRWAHRAASNAFDEDFTLAAKSAARTIEVALRGREELVVARAIAELLEKVAGVE